MHSNIVHASKNPDLGTSGNPDLYNHSYQLRLGVMYGGESGYVLNCHVEVNVPGIDDWNMNNVFFSSPGTTVPLHGCAITPSTYSKYIGPNLG